jgi:hypothetical protein
MLPLGKFMQLIAESLATMHSNPNLDTLPFLTKGPYHCLICQLSDRVLLQVLTQ